MHDEDEPCFAEHILNVLIPELLREKVIPEDALLNLADRLDIEAGKEPSVRREQELQDMALRFRFWAIEAAGPTKSEWEAEERRNKLRIVQPPDSD